VQFDEKLPQFNLQFEEGGTILEEEGFTLMELKDEKEILYQCQIPIVEDLTVFFFLSFILITFLFFL